MNEYTLQIITGAGIVHDVVDADHVKMDDDVYLFVNYLDDDQRDYQVIALYPKQHTIISKMRKLEK